jgi:hypothetical protein
MSVNEAEVITEDDEGVKAPDVMLERPDFLPEKFWTEDSAGDPLKVLQTVSASYSELEQRQRTKEEDLRGLIEKELQEKSIEGVPATPADYVLSFPEELGIELQDDGVVIQEFRSFAHEKNLPQDVTNEILAFYGKAIMDTMPNEEAEKKLIGDDFDGRLSRMSLTLEKHLSPEDFTASKSLFMDAATFKMMETVAKVMSTGGSNHSEFDGGDPPMSDTDTAAIKTKIDELQSSDAYWGKGGNATEADRIRKEVGQLHDQLAKTKRK